MGTLESEDPTVVGMVQATQLAIGEYNDDPDSRYEIEFRQFSADSGPGEAGTGQGDIEQTARLIGVVGPFTAEEVNSLGPGFSEAQMPFVVPSVNTPSAPPDGVNGFRRLIANSTQEGRVLAAHIAGLVDGGIALVTENSDPGRELSEGTEQLLGELKRPPVRTERVEPDSSMDALATALSTDSPDAVLYGGGGATGSALVQALKTQGYQGRIVTSHQVREHSPDGLGSGVIGSSLFAEPGEAAPGFVQAFEQAYGSVPSRFALEAYEGAWMLLEAIEEVQADAQAVSEFLQSNRTFRGESKVYEFDESGEQPNGPVWIYESAESGWSLTGRSDRVSESDGE
ncbi:MAG: branched-chain amino acid ABC transporter substrate-binding protein [Actinomycetota bacterium]